MPENRSLFWTPISILCKNPVYKSFSLISQSAGLWFEKLEIKLSSRIRASALLTHRFVKQTDVSDSLETGLICTA